MGPLNDPVVGDVTYTTADGRSYFLPDVELKPPTEWYGSEIVGDAEMEFLLETIGPVEEEMRRTVYELFTYYRSHDTSTYVVFEYDFIDEEIVAYLVLPKEIFHKLWEFKAVQYDLWNEVRRRPLESRGLVSEGRETAAVAEVGTANEWAEGR